MGVLGMGIALAGAVMWRLINFGYLAVPHEWRIDLSELTFFLCPSSFVLMEVGPRESISLQVAGIYAEVILINGALYGAITFLVLKLAGLLKKKARPAGD